MVTTPVLSSFTTGYGSCDLVTLLMWSHIINWQMVRLDEVFPLRGPVSGGTTINITWENLNIGNSQTVLVGDRQCLITNITSWVITIAGLVGNYGNMVLLSCSEFITCETPSNDEGTVAIVVSVDRFSDDVTRRFRYVGDPVYSNIIPRHSFTS